MLISQGSTQSPGIVSQGLGNVSSDFIPFDGDTTLAAFVLDRGRHPAAAYGTMALPTVKERDNSQLTAGRFGVPILSESMTIAFDLISETLTTDKMGLGEIKASAKKVSGTLSCDGQYEGLERLIAAAMGFENPIITKQGLGSPHQPIAGIDVFEHLFELDDRLSGISWQFEDVTGATFEDMTELDWKFGDQKLRRGTLFVKMDYGIVAHKGCYITQMNITGAVNSVIKFDFGLSAHSSELLEDQKIPFWQPAQNPVRILFSDLTCKIKTFNSEEKFENLPIADFSINLSNNLATDNLSFRGQDQNDSQEVRQKAGQAIDEPYRNGRRDVNGTFSLPRINDNNDKAIEFKTIEFLKTSLFTGQPKDNLFSLSFEFESTDETFLLRIDFPKVHLAANTNLASAGINPVGLDFTALRPRAGEVSSEEVNGNPFDYNSALAKNNEMVVVLRNTIEGNLFRPENLL